VRRARGPAGAASATIGLVCRPLVVVLLASAGCLSSPPGGVDTPSDDGDPADATSGRDGPGGDAAATCAGLELLVESFEEADPESRFLELWDPGLAQYGIEGGALTLTAENGEAQINSIDFYDRIGSLRFEGVTESGTGGFIALSLYGAPSAARILIADATIDLYAPPSHHLSIERDLSLTYFRIGFAGGEVELAASMDGTAWMDLARWPDEFDEAPVRVALAAHHAAGSLTLILGGINAVTGPGCE